MTPSAPNLSQGFYDILSLTPDGMADLVVRGSGHTRAYAKLVATDPSQLIANPPKDLQMLQAIVGSLYLYDDWLEESHKIAQANHTETGSFWHAIMHRRAGDFSNSIHWYAHCRNHPVMRAIGSQAAVILGDLPADNRIIRLTLNGFDADTFVALVRKYEANKIDPLHEVLVTLQRLEWRVLTEYCAALA